MHLKVVVNYNLTDLICDDFLIWVGCLFLSTGHRQSLRFNKMALVGLGLA
jgi:hypothetical protein